MTAVESCTPAFESSLFCQGLGLDLGAPVQKYPFSASFELLGPDYFMDREQQRGRTNPGAHDTSQFQALIADRPESPQSPPPFLEYYDNVNPEYLFGSPPRSETPDSKRKRTMSQPQRSNDDDQESKRARFSERPSQSSTSQSGRVSLPSQIEPPSTHYPPIFHGGETSSPQAWPTNLTARQQLTSIPSRRTSQFQQDPRLQTPGMGGSTPAANTAFTQFAVPSLAQRRAQTRSPAVANTQQNPSYYSAWAPPSSSAYSYTSSPQPSYSSSSSTTGIDPSATTTNFTPFYSPSDPRYSPGNTMISTRATYPAAFAPISLPSPSMSSESQQFQPMYRSSTYPQQQQDQQEQANTFQGQSKRHRDSTSSVIERVMSEQSRRPSSNTPRPPQDFSRSSFASSHSPSITASASSAVDTRSPLSPGDSSRRRSSTRVEGKDGEKPRCWEHGCGGREFSTFSNLLRHQREKAGTAQKSNCPTCGAEFTRTTARNSHLKMGKCKREVEEFGGRRSSRRSDDDDDAEGDE